jgi:hypothetical protein
MPSSFVARLLESPAEREHKNLYGKGISPSYNGKDVVSIAFENTTKELAEAWLTDHEFAGVALEEIPEQLKTTTRALAIDISSSGGKFERNGNALTIKNVKLLATGVHTDSLQKTPWRVKPDVLERHAANWTDDTVWNRHAGGQHRAVTDKIGNVQNIRYQNEAATGDVVLHGLTQNSRDAAALVEAGQINHVSVETSGSDRWNVGTKEFEAQDITFTGLALVNRGACKVCTLRENGGPGSGNFGHSGIPGQQGGSSSEGGGDIKPAAVMGAKYTNQKAEYESAMKKGMEDVDKILNDKLTKPQKIEELRKINIFLDSSVKSGDIRSEAEKILHARHVPGFYFSSQSLEGDTVRENSEPEEKIEIMTPEEIAAIKADIKKELAAEQDPKILALETKLAAAEKKVKELSEAEAQMKTIDTEADRDLAEPTGYRVDIDSDGNVCRVI